MGVTPPDAGVRERIEREFSRSFLVEAGAGSGKTECLARRMAGGIATGAYTVEHMAAVTFTRKAAAELRGRFQRALEERLARDGGATVAERHNIEVALAGLERLFAGTIHSFCAALLRERPVEAGRAPDFTELDDVEDLRLRKQAWRDYWTHQRTSGSEHIVALQQAGVREADLDGAFGRVCDHADVEFPAARTEPPDFTSVRTLAGDFLATMDRLAGPKGIPAGTKCPLQKKLLEFRRMWGSLHGYRPGRIAEALASLDRADSAFDATKKWWSGDSSRATSAALAFRDEVVRPVLGKWREYLYGVAVVVLTGARAHYAEQRRRLNVVNYVDLLGEAARLLREHPEVRSDLQRKYRWLFVDEFQDTDPIQAELLLWLASDEGGSGDPWSLPLRPGALFIVGDPKQSIYRFRRADIEVYNQLRNVFLASPERSGVLALTANFRSQQAVCDAVNAFGQVEFPEEPTPHSPRYEPLVPADPAREADRLSGVRVLTVPRHLKVDPAAADEADRVARIISAMVRDGRRYGEFLILTQKKDSLATFAEVLDSYDIPVEVSGAGRFASAPEVRALAVLLRALADASDQAALVGVLRGPMFGISDPDLFHYVQSGAALDLSFPLVEEEDAAQAGAFDERHGPVRPAMRLLRELTSITRRFPLPIALDAIVDRTGWLALASAAAGGTGAGRVLQAIDCARLVLADGGGLAEAAGALEGEEDGGDVEAWPLEPGRSEVVRLMNLHKAKGLEAPVVFLADANRALPDRVDLRVERRGGVAQGFFSITESGDYKTQVIAAPADWARHQQEEKAFKDAERMRLMYVAGTRAGELLVISRLAPDPAAKPKREAWQALLTHLDEPAEIDVPAAPKPARKPVVDLGASARSEADERRAAALARVAQPSWAVSLVTTETKKVAWSRDGATGESAEEPAVGEGTATPGAAPAAHAGAGAKAPARRPPASAVHAGAGGTRAALTVLGAAQGEALQAIIPDTPSHRAERNAAWGVLIHGLLEHAMRAGARVVSAEELTRLGHWLTIETPELRPHVAAAVAIARSVTAAPFWREALEAEERHVEVPFAVRLEAGERGPDGVVLERPLVLHGVIDLVHSSPSGWQVRDYKTGAMPPEMMTEKYGPQLAAYVDAWRRVAGSPRG